MTERVANDYGAIKRRMDEMEREKARNTSANALASGGRGTITEPPASLRRRWRKGDLVLGRTRSGKKFIWTDKGRKTHGDIIGLPNMGKSSLLESVVRQDILNEQGLCLIDIDGSLVKRLGAFVAAHGLDRRRKIRIIKAADLHHRFGFNPLRRPAGYELAAIVDTVIAGISTAWGDEELEKTPRLQKCLRAMLSLLVANNLTLCEVPHLLGGPDAENVREYLLANLENPMFRWIWSDFSSMRVAEFREQFESFINRISAFLDAPVVKGILGQQVDVIDLRRSMDEGEVILLDLEPNEELGYSLQDAKLLGNLIVSGVVSAAMGRPADISRPFTLVIDEAYHFVNRDIETLLDRARKRGLRLLLAHQRVAQLRDKGDAVADSVLEETQTKIVFRTGRSSALELGYDLFGDTFDLEKPKAVLTKPVAVGQEIVTLRAWNKSRGKTKTRTKGQGEGETIADTTSRGRTKSVADAEIDLETESASSARGEGESEGLNSMRGRGAGKGFSHMDSMSETGPTGGFFMLVDDDDFSTTESEADGYNRSESEFSAEGLNRGRNRMRVDSTGNAQTRGNVHTESEAETEGEAHTRGRSIERNRSDAEGVSENEGESTHETFRTLYEERVGATYSLDEHKHEAAKCLTTLEERYAFVKVQNYPPIEIKINTVKPAPVSKRRYEEFLAKLTALDEYTKPVALIEQELAERPIKLIQQAAQWRFDQEQVLRQAETDDDYNE